MYELIHAERASFPVSFCCRVAGVSRSGYYQWRSAQGSKRKHIDASLTAQIRDIHREHKGRYGSPRIHRELRERGVHVSRKRVARLMREEGLHGRTRRRFRHATDSRHGYRIAPNLVARDFTAALGSPWRRARRRDLRGLGLNARGERGRVLGHPIALERPWSRLLARGCPWRPARPPQSGDPIRVLDNQ